MLNKIITGIGIFLVIISLVAAIYFIEAEQYDGAYKCGQVDALTGKIKYHIIVKSDSTKEWEKIVK